MTSELAAERVALGARGEAIATAHLIAQGFEIAQARARTRHGELDIVAWRWETRYGAQVLQVVVVEVKTRRGPSLCRPEASLTWRKRARIARLAADYVRACDWADCAIRLDVIAIEIARDDAITLRHYPAAFDALGRL